MSEIDQNDFITCQTHGNEDNFEDYEMVEKKEPSII